MTLPNLFEIVRIFNDRTERSAFCRRRSFLLLCWTCRRNLSWHDRILSAKLICSSVDIRVVLILILKWKNSKAGLLIRRFRIPILRSRVDVIDDHEDSFVEEVWRQNHLNTNENGWLNECPFLSRSRSALVTSPWSPCLISKSVRLIRVVDHNRVESRVKSFEKKTFSVRFDHFHFQAWPVKFIATLSIVLNVVSKTNWRRTKKNSTGFSVVDGIYRFRPRRNVKRTNIWNIFERHWTTITVNWCK